MLVSVRAFMCVCVCIPWEYDPSVGARIMDDYNQAPSWSPICSCRTPVPGQGLWVVVQHLMPALHLVEANEGSSSLGTDVPASALQIQTNAGSLEVQGIGCADRVTKGPGFWRCMNGWIEGWMILFGRSDTV